MSLGSILSTAAPIAAGYFAPGAGAFLGSATANAVAAGALTGMGIAALSGGDVLSSGVMGGLGGYAGGEMFTAFNPAAGVDASIKAGTTTAVTNEAMLSPYTNATASQAAGSAGSNMGMFANPSAVSGGTSYAGLTGSTGELGANMNFGSQYIDRSFSAGVERLGGGDSVMGYGKLGLAGLPVVASAFEPETFTYDQMKEAEAYDPDETLNLLDPALDSGIEDVINEDSGLRLYANQGGMVPTYAEGGTVESRADQGMKDALARNKGTAYTRPTTTPSTPTTAPSNIKIAGAGNSTTNLTGGVGSLNVGSGSIGQSANAVAETARLKAIEDAKPKTRMMTGAYGTQMTVPIDYDPGGYTRKPSHYQLKDGTYVKGTPPSANYFNSDRTNSYGYVNRFAEGGTVETRADQGMRDALARNQGTAYAQPTTNASSNVNTGSTLNINRGMGSLNVGSGTIGQSANAIAAGAEAARLKAIEDAKPKTPPMQFIMGQGMRPVGAIEAGPLANYSRNMMGGYTFRGKQYYAEGGTIESRADQGMKDALARNQGTAYTRPTTAPVTTTAPSNNIKIAGANNSTSNIGAGSTSNLIGGVGALNVGSGSIGQSPNAIKAAQVAAADRKANFKIMPNGQEVPIDFVPSYSGGVMEGMQTVPQSHYRDSSGNWHKGQKPGTFQIGGNNGIGNQFSWLTGANYYAQGGAVKGYAQGGMLEGPGDGMSDSLAAQIDGSQPAALSQGEFVVPADVVSHLGNGSSDAGSKRLYAMMDEVRQARTGTEKQGKEINPERYMPA